MFITTCQHGELFRIGSGISVRILEVSRGRVTIGIEAPEGLRIVRCARADIDANDSKGIGFKRHE